MEAFEGLAYGMSLVFTPELLLAALVGALAGSAIGVLPGLGPVAGAALLLPLTFSLSPGAGVIMIVAVYAGAMYGGSTTAVLMNMPGESASVVTTIDGYEMTRQGRSGAALSIMAVGSFVAGTIGIVLVTAASPFLAKVGLWFGPAEYLALTAGGLLALARVSGGSPASGLFPMIIGVMLATVGQEAVTGTYRYTFGIQELGIGISLAPVAIGLFGLAELMLLVESPTESRRVLRPRFRELFPTRQDWRRAWAPWGRGSVVGFLFGLVPGPSATLSSFVAYRLEKGVSKHRDQLGKGAVEGVAGPEAANNAAAIGSVVPLLSLGLPFSATLALAISALMAQGVEPGPLLISDHPDIFWAVVASLYVANVMLLVLNLPLVGVWVSLLRVPRSILLPTIVVVALIGAYSLHNSMLDVVLLLIMGVVGYVLRKLEFNLVSFVVGLVLGPLIEKHFREGLFLSGGDLGYFVSTPLAASIWALALVVMFAGTIGRLLRRRVDPTGPNGTGPDRVGQDGSGDRHAQQNSARGDGA